MCASNNDVKVLPVNDTTVHGTWWDSYPYRYIIRTINIFTIFFAKSSISVFALHPIYIHLEALGDVPKHVLDEIEKHKPLLDKELLDYEVTPTTNYLSCIHL